VFNFDVPTHAEDYVHRIGRTGRAGRDGMAISIACPSDAKLLAAIEKMIAKPIPRREIADMAPVDETAEASDAAPRNRRGRTERPKRAERPAKPDAAAKPAKAAVEKPAPKAAPPSFDEEQPYIRPDQRPQANARFDRSRGRNYANQYNDGPSPIGFGDFLPAFMRIEVRLPPEKPARVKKGSAAAAIDPADLDEAELDVDIDNDPPLAEAV